MITLENDSLVFRFPEVHPDAAMTIDFQRTLRIPDDDGTYPLPPGLGRFPCRHVDDFPARVPEAWIERGGIMLPMYQAEAMWLNFTPRYLSRRDTAYPFLIKVAAGKINAVTGEPWSDGPQRDPQDYLVAPQQPWLDGFCVEKGLIRQFVAMPLGSGYSAEEQITGAAEYGGVQIAGYPMKRAAFERRFPVRDEIPVMARRARLGDMAFVAASAPPGAAMGLAPGGRMRQELYDDPFDFDDWDLRHSSRCFVHLTNALQWREITGENPPTTPPTAREYARAGLPWFDYYGGDAKALKGAPVLRRLKSLARMARAKGDVLPANESVRAERVVHLRSGLKRGQVREGRF